jgi:flotillin
VAVSLRHRQEGPWVKEASITETRARQAAQQEQLLADEAIVVSQRQLAFKQAEIDAESTRLRPVPPRPARSPRPLQDQEVLAAQKKVAERTATLNQAQLDTKGAPSGRRRPLPGGAGGRGPEELHHPHRGGQRQSTLAAAQAAAEQARLSGEAERARRSALAEAEAASMGARSAAVAN